MRWAARVAPRPTKRNDEPTPPTAVCPTERAAGVAAKVPTAKPPTAPMAAPRKNLVVPSPNEAPLGFSEPERGKFSTGFRGFVAEGLPRESPSARRLLTGVYLAPH